MKNIFFTLTIILLITTSKTQAQNDSIFSWKSGNIKYKRSIKPADLDSITFKTPLHFLQLGQHYQGGVIFYFFNVGEPGYIAGEQHGLIAATADIFSPVAFYWEATVYIRTTGATGTALGTGLSNTNLIIETMGNDIYAAKFCRDYKGGGYRDWFLPSKDELNKLILNNTLVDDFATYYPYWSSTETSPTTALSQSFFNGVNSSAGKSTWVAKTRAVRRF